MRLLQIIIFSISMVTTLQAQNKPERVVNWISFEQLTDSLEINPKPVLLFFHTDWCSYCRKMLNETFKDQQVIEKLNAEYYAVEFDAESIDSVYFDGITYTNSVLNKRRGKFHQIFKILIGTNHKATFPAIMVLNTDFSVIELKNKYLSVNQILNIL